jgi:(p)ppGpp synthase/HD superfamily hydrolase
LIVCHRSCHAQPVGDDRITELKRVAERIHDGQLDQQGVAYIEHIRRVAGAVSESAKPVALFHDAIEDDRIAPDELRALLTDDEFRAVCALTRDKQDESYSSFIERVATFPGRPGELAREVKVADVRDNLGRLTPELERLRARYEAALRRLGD